MHVTLSKGQRLLLIATGLLVTACSQKPATAPVKPVAKAEPAPIVSRPDPNAKVQTEAVERFSFDEQYQGPAEGSLASAKALFARGYVDSALRETMLGAVHNDYPMLGLRDVRLTDPVARFLTSGRAISTAQQYLRTGLEARMGAMSDARFQQIWQSLPQNGQVRHWSARIKQVMAGR